ncbi:MAG: transposase [Anaerolineales bacterium]
MYQYGFTRRKDAQSELLDALLLKDQIASFPILSCSAAFTRRLSSAYAALEKGQQDTAWLSSYLAKQAPETGIQFFSLDCTAWARPEAHTLPDRQYVYQPSRTNQGSVVVIGHAYSLLDWVPEHNSSWSLSVDVERVSSQKTSLEVGVEQIRRLRQARGSRGHGLDIVSSDAKYGNHHFLDALKDQSCGIVVRLRKDRVLFRPVQERKTRKRGRPRKHGPRFAFKEPETWGEPCEFAALEHPRWGSVEIRRWNDLHAWQSVDTWFDVVQVQAHLERDEPPAPLWLAWLAPATTLADIHVDAKTIWHAYQHRWSIEPGIRFRKQRLWWTLPQFQLMEAADRWGVLVSLAMWMLYLARPVVQDQPLSWQRSQCNLTPGRVKRGMGAIFRAIGNPALPPKPRGIPPGWPKGKERKRRERFPG